LFRCTGAFLIGLVAAIHCATSLAADSYPSRPIRLVLNVGTGGVGDVTNRVVAQQLSRSLGQQVVVDNRPSAGGTAAATAVANAAPDGYTLLQTGNAGAISATLFKKLPYDVLRDFTQISTIGFFELVVLATPESRFTSLADVIAYARKNANKLNVGTINVGSTQFLAAEMLKSMAGINFQIVPFKSNTLLFTALRGNELPVAFEMVGPALTHIRSGALKAIAVGSERRYGGLPEVPTIAESVPGFSVYSWTGISAPARTPRPIVDRLAKDIAAAVAVPEVKQKLQELGIEARSSTPEETRKMMIADIAKWKAVIERAGIERQ
jgi:tripartite-type tricarboxylate transporter receptor subunit TctC